MAKRMPLQPGEKAPDVELWRPDGSSVRLSSLWRDKTVVLYFYPADFTPGCTAESCSFRDSYQDFQDAGAEVVGVSGDSGESHQAFAQKHRLPFLLLTDRDNRAREAFGVGKSLFFMPGRVTFVIDREGINRFTFDSQFRATQHVPRALEVVKQTQAARPSAQPG